MNRAKTINEAFNMLYARFMSSERRDRLLQKWNNLKISDFTAKPGVSRHTSLRDMYSLASSVQLQLGTCYQDDQHLRDTLANACKNKPWSHRLAAMPTNRLFDIEESLARAITAEEELESSKRKVFPAFSNEVSLADYLNDVNFNKNRCGLPYRKYGSGKEFPPLFSTPYKKADGKNPIRDYMRLLCRLCLSDEHLLRECPKRSPTKRVRLVRKVFSLSSIPSESEQCFAALDTIQQLNDEEWKECAELVSDEEQKISNDITWTCCVKIHPCLFQTKNYDSTLNEMADRAFSHSVLWNSNKHNYENQQILINSRSSPLEFDEICMDDGAQKSVTGLEAYKKYCVYTCTPVDIVPSKESFKLGSGIYPSL